MGSSNQAYAALIESGKQNTQQGKVLYAVLNHAPITRRQLVRATGLEMSSVCGRVAELQEAGLITVNGDVECGITGQQVELLVTVTADDGHICCEHADEPVQQTDEERAADVTSANIANGYV